MLVTKRNKCGVAIGEVYFAPSPTITVGGADVIIYLQSRQERIDAVCFHTIHIDLRLPSDELFDRIVSRARQRIRRAEREQIGYALIDQPSEADIRRFCRFYDRFASSKGIPASNLAKLQVLAGQDALVLSAVFDHNSVLCMHASIADGERARILYMASTYKMFDDSAYRNHIGRAHRLQIWRDIVALKNKNLTIFDLGGLAIDETSQELRNINTFKRSFGGVEVVEYNILQPLTYLGQAAVWYQRWKRGGV